MLFVVVVWREMDGDGGIAGVGMWRWFGLFE